MTVIMTQGFASEANVANIGIFYTNDAGPQIKIICDPKSANTIKDTISLRTDVIDIIHTGLGGSPRIIDEN